MGGWAPAGTDGCPKSLQREFTRVAGTVNLGVGHRGCGLTCFIALGRDSDSKPKGWGRSGSLRPMGLAGPLSTSASQEASLLARPYSVGFATP